MHSFHAFIDEAGDEGFKIKPFPDKGSSEWFVLSACVIRASKIANASRKYKLFLDPLEQERKAPAHFANLNHDCRVAFCQTLTQLPIVTISICIHKGAMGPPGPFDGERRLHFYAMRYLMERISWIARDRRRVDDVGNAKCQLVFSHCKGIDYAKLRSYFDLLRTSPNATQIYWNGLDTENLSVKAHKESVWLRAADAIASGTAKALELSNYGYCEDRYVTTLKPVAYKNGTKYLGYGLKFFPKIPSIEENRANRYEWLALFKQ